jgi:hypothetical protein
MLSAAATPDMGEGDTLLNALVGAGVTVILSFTGFSPVIGGGVAGYLQRSDRMGGARVGAISGAIATLPFLLLAVVVFGFFGLLAGIPMGPRAIGASLFGLVAVLFGFLLVVVWTVGLSAVGGYLGVYVAEETDAGRSTSRSS